jgi:hypothetical protein
VRTRVVFHSCGFFTTSTARGGLHKVAPVSRRCAVASPHCSIVARHILAFSIAAICAANPPSCIARRARLIERACPPVQQSMGGWLAEWRTFAMQASCLCTESAGKTNKPQDRYRQRKSTAFRLPSPSPPHPIHSPVRSRAASRANPCTNAIPIRCAARITQARRGADCDWRPLRCFAGAALGSAGQQCLVIGTYHARRIRFDACVERRG